MLGGLHTTRFTDSGRFLPVGRSARGCLALGFRDLTSATFLAFPASALILAAGCCCSRLLVLRRVFAARVPTPIGRAMPLLRLDYCPPGYGAIPHWDRGEKGT